MQETFKSPSYNQKEVNILGDLVKKYLPYWPLYLLFVGMAIIATFFKLRYQVPLYQANAKLLIKDEMKGSSEQSELLRNFNEFGSGKLIENEIEIIKSRRLAREVARNLHLYASVYQEGRVNDASAYHFAPIKVVARYPDSIKEGKVYFKFNAKGKAVEIEDKKYNLQQWYRFSFGEIMFVPNSYANSLEVPATPAKEAEQKPHYFTLSSVKAVSYGLLGRVKVAPAMEYGSVLKLEILDDVPKRAEDILNEWISAYTRAAVEDKNTLARNTMAFIEDRLKYVVGDLDSVEHKVERFKATNNVLDISEQGKIFLAGVGDNDKKLGELNLQMAVLSQVENYVASKNTKVGIVPSTVGVSDPVLMQLLNSLYDSESQFERLKNIGGENHPSTLALGAQIDKMRGSIMENLRNQRRGLEASRGEVASANNKYTSMLSSLPKKERQLVDISRQQAIKNNIYTFLLQKREETALSSASTVADSRILDVADSNYSPIVANKRMMYAMAILGALLLGIGLVTAKEALNKTIMSREEVEKLSGIPILGEIIYDRSNKPLVISDGKRTFIAEQFRHLRTYLGYLGVNSRNKKIMVTSSMTGEGKSFVAANLGISLALMGKKTILLELDLRKPKLSQAFNVSRAVGISNYLIGDKEAEDIIKPTEVNPNLFIITSGPIPPNPTELLMNGRLRELFDYLEQHFDSILIDTAPINPVTDAFILMPMCDATLYIVRQGYTPKTGIQKLDELYRINNQKNTAIIFNGIRPRGFAGYGVGYGYGYGYGYTQEEKTKKKRTNIFSKSL